MSGDSKLTIPGTTISLVNPDWLTESDYKTFQPCLSGTPSETDDYVEWVHDGQTEKLCTDRAKSFLEPAGLWPVPKSW